MLKHLLLALLHTNPVNLGLRPVRVCLELAAR